MPKPSVSSNSPPEPVFFVDRDLGAYKLPSVLKAGGLAVEIHKDHFPPGALDAEWLPVVAAKGWVIVTHDKGISRNPMEIAACLNSEARVFVLRGQATTDVQAENFLKVQKRVKHLLTTHAGAFIARVYLLKDESKKALRESVQIYLPASSKSK